MSRKARIGFTRDFTDSEGNFLLPGPGLKLLEEIPNTEREVLKELPPEVTPQQIEDFDTIITRPYARWTERSFTGNNQLLYIHRSGVGYDRIDVSALTKAGIMLCITPGAVRRPMATTALTFILALSTRLILKHKLTSEGKWSEVHNYHGVGLAGKTLGLIGVGNIGHELFKLVKPFGMKHIAYDPYVKAETAADVGVKLVDLDTLLTESDFISIHCPLNEKTRHLIGEKELKKMKKTAYLINTARGPIIDESILIRALRERWIQGAGIDVFEEEPTSPDNPLLKLDNVIVTAHAMGFTDEYLTRVWEIIAGQVAQIMRGELPEGVVNREVWDKPIFQSKRHRFLEDIGN